MEKEVLNLILVEIREMKGDMSEVKDRLTNVEELAEFNKETSQSIKNVVVNHYMEFKKHIKANNTQHNLSAAKLLQFNKED